MLDPTNQHDIVVAIIGACCAFLPVLCILVMNWAEYWNAQRKSRQSRED